MGLGTVSPGLGLVFALVSSAYSALLAGEPPKDMGRSFASQCAEQGKLLADKLAEDALWKDPERALELVGYLNMVGALRATAVAPVLVGRVLCEPFPRPISQVPYHMQHPACGALVKIGLPSVRYILAEMKKTNPRDGSGESRRKHYLLAWCISDIYEQGRPEPVFQQGDHGSIMGRKRIEIEIQETKLEGEKANLRAALETLIFTERKPDAPKRGTGAP